MKGAERDRFLDEVSTRGIIESEVAAAHAEAARVAPIGGDAGAEPAQPSALARNPFIQLWTTVQGVDIPVREIYRPAIVFFSAGARGRQEAGPYAFWTAVLDDVRHGWEVIYARARVGLPAGERFDRMHAERALPGAPGEAYAKFCACMEGLAGQATNIHHIRPATVEEIISWLSTHDADAQFAQWALPELIPMPWAKTMTKDEG